MVGVAGTLVLVGEIRLLTGTRIGTSEEEIEIGGLDNPVIKDPVTGYPYVPGSSLKGRCRALFELAWMEECGVDEDTFFGGHHNQRHECGFVRPEIVAEALKKGELSRKPPWLEEGLDTCPVCRLYGTAGHQLDRFECEAANTKKEARVAFRDAHPTRYTVNQLIERVGEPTEVKHENAIERVTGEANPRQMERALRNSRFGLEIVYRVESERELESDLRHLLASLKLVEDQGIGHSTSRGYGRVEFRIAAVCARSTGWYLNPGDGEEFPAEKDLEAVEEEEVSHLHEREPERYEVVVRAWDLTDRGHLRPEEWMERLDDVLGRLPWGQ
ncbi:MAG: type III-A CRISPR-associated RAMP protein Csm3 [Euryarchaeota archaeon]